ncbi:inovirus Gp2 family protein [Ralstonia pseudosolanacearum]|uniref:inovirus-type Gp2 protein n=1 Tax=Ralstonia pseudosolanacearum TaxID=1310165 RepID=UPI0002D92B4B|nr:inovirus-type Gp2 protein [Ralstonia pseudosolanacearum]MCK4125257.1 inovirus Gp2 family protein [Ralstonia pseudosolanacearum]
MHDSKYDQEALEVSARLDESESVKDTKVNEKGVTGIPQRYASRHLFRIERFVDDIINNKWQGGYVDEVSHLSGVRRIRELYLGHRYYRQVTQWIERYSSRYHYSMRVTAFYDACKGLGLIGQTPFVFGEPGESTGVGSTRYMDLFNRLIEQIRARCQSREFKERERLRSENAKQNLRNVMAMEEAMFSSEKGRSRWLILSLTLRYKSRFRGWITPETLQQHRDRFFAARRFNTLMSGIKNYVWAIEQGEDAGLHMHVLLFYSAESNHDEFIAKQIGEYWANIVTQGKGDYWNSNAAPLKLLYEQRGHGVGVGQINWNDAEKREALRKNLAYLAKADQQLMARETESIRTFDMGQVPEKVKPGRPRAAIDPQVSEVDGVVQTVGVVDIE